MVNLLRGSKFKVLLRPMAIASLTFLALTSSDPACAGAKYKKSTVIDFEGALVEGKSRKPYSAYLTQQKESAFGELHQWAPDLDRRLLEAQTRLDRSK